jgi:hypothetical protein
LKEATSRVMAFSFTRRSSRAASHSSRETTCREESVNQRTSWLEVRSYLTLPGISVFVGRIDL